MGNQKLARISQNESSKKDEVSYFLTDALGSATFITYHHTASPNDALRITESLLDPWGNSVKNGFFNQTKVQDFTGKAVDEASTLYDFGFRFYDPFLATWIGKDLVPADHSAPLTLNEYLYALGNPLRWVDPDGRRVTVWAQEVAFGQYHSSIRIVPDNQELYVNNHNFKVGEDGTLFATLGAGASTFGILTNGIDRERDMLLDNKVLESLPLKIPGLSEDAAISKLFELQSAYSNNIDYDLFPAIGGKQLWNDGYNSNSYTTGLLKAVGFDIPPLNNFLSMPGYDKPLPKINFESNGSGEN